MRLPIVHTNKFKFRHVCNYDSNISLNIALASSHSIERTVQRPVILQRTRHVGSIIWDVWVMTNMIAT